MLQLLDRLGQVGLQTENQGILYVSRLCQVFQTKGLLIETQCQVLWLSILAEHVRDCQFPPRSMRDTGGKGRLAFPFCEAFLVWGGYHAAFSTERSASLEIDLEHKQPARTCICRGLKFESTESRQ